MDNQHLQELIAIEETYWWHVAKRSLVLSVLRHFFPAPARLIEAGIGGGGNLKSFRQLGYECAGLDLSADSIAHAQSQGLEASQHDLTEPWPFPEQSADVVVLLDVLEHLPDASKALRHASLCLKESGGIVFTVPAYPFLLGPWDKMLGHYRRYTRKMVRSEAREAGLNIRWLSSWNSFSVPPALLIRTLERWRSGDRSAEFPKVSPALNQTLLTMAKWERGWMRFLPVPVGLSLVGVLTR